MNEDNELVKNKNIKKPKKKKQTINLKVNIRKTYLKIRQTKINYVHIGIISTIIIIFLGFFVLHFFKINNNNHNKITSLVPQNEIKFDIKKY